MPRTATSAHRRPRESVGIHGYFRAQLRNATSGAVEGDSGWIRNIITDSGYTSFLIGPLAGAAGSSQASWIAIGNSSAADVTNTSTALPGASSDYKRLGTAAGATTSIVSTKTWQWAASWATSDLNTTVGSIGLYNASSGSTLMCGQTFASSTKTTSQTLTATYQVRFT